MEEEAGTMPLVVGGVGVAFAIRWLTAYSEEW